MEASIIPVLIEHPEGFSLFYESFCAYREWDFVKKLSNFNVVLQTWNQGSERFKESNQRRAMEVIETGVFNVGSDDSDNSSGEKDCGGDGDRSVLGQREEDKKDAAGGESEAEPIEQLSACSLDNGDVQSDAEDAASTSWSANCTFGSFDASDEDSYADEDHEDNTRGRTNGLPTGAATPNLNVGRLPFSRTTTPGTVRRRPASFSQSFAPTPRRPSQSFSTRTPARFTRSRSESVGGASTSRPRAVTTSSSPARSPLRHMQHPSSHPTASTLAVARASHSADNRTTQRRLPSQSALDHLANYDVSASDSEQNESEIERVEALCKKYGIEPDSEWEGDLMDGTP